MRFGVTLINDAAHFPVDCQSGLIRHGFGRLIMANGDCYIGLWQNDRQNGPGRFSDGEAIQKGELGIPNEGMWVGGKI